MALRKGRWLWSKWKPEPPCFAQSHLPLRKATLVSANLILTKVALRKGRWLRANQSGSDQSQGGSSKMQITLRNLHRVRSMSTCTRCKVRRIIRIQCKFRSMICILVWATVTLTRATFLCPEPPPFAQSHLGSSQIDSVEGGSAQREVALGKGRWLWSKWKP